MKLITATFRLCGIGAKKTIAEFNQELSCIHINLLFMSITLWNENASEIIAEVTRYAMRDRAWLVEHAPGIRLAKRLAYAKGKAEGKALAAELGYRESYLQERCKVIELQQRTHELDTTVRVLSGLVDKKRPRRGAHK